MPIPENTSRLDPTTGLLTASNLGTWANLAATKEIVISSDSLGTDTANLIVGNIGFGNITVYNTTTANSNVIVLGTTNSNIANISVGMTVWRNNVAANVTVTEIRNSTSGLTWDSWRNWNNEPAEYFLHSTEIIDLGKISYFNLVTDTVSSGNVYYTVRTNTTLAFDGTETVANVANNDEDISAFYGRYVCVTANVVSQGSQLTLSRLGLTAKTDKIMVSADDISSGDLAGTNSSRVLDLGRAVSHIYNVQMTPHVSDAYIVSDYVVTGYFLDQVPNLPVIVSKSNGGANVAFQDADGNYTDCIFDAVVFALPEQYMTENNIRER